MRLCLVYLISAGLLTGCTATQKNSVDNSPSIVRAVVRTSNVPHAEDGGAATYYKEHQHMLSMQPPIVGEYVKLEPKASGAALFEEFKVPPPKVMVTESKTRNIVVFFKFNSSTLNRDARNTLKEIAAGSPDAIKVSVQGYADSIGKAKANLALSKKRSDSIVQALVDGGIDGSRIDGDGFGSDSPIDDNKDLAGRARNRRVEITIVGEETVINGSATPMQPKTRK